MKGWQTDKAWSDKYLPNIKRILGEHLIGAAPLEEDQERNTDLIVLRMDAVRIGCRIRRETYAKRYGNEFTIRIARPSGMKTELAKIIEGWGDYFFYGFACNSADYLIGWLLGDLKVFRLWFMRKMSDDGGNYPGIKQKNKDGSSDFLAFNVNDMPKGFLVARMPPRSSMEVPQLTPEVANSEECLF